MSKLFYDHLIILQDIIVELEQYEIPAEDRKQFMITLDEILHHHILDTVLLFLPHEHHQYFLERFTHEPHSLALLDFLQEKTKVDIEHEIKQTVDYVKKKILRDLKDSEEK